MLTFFSGLSPVLFPSVFGHCLLFGKWVVHDAQSICASVIRFRRMCGWWTLCTLLLPLFMTRYVRCGSPRCVDSGACKAELSLCVRHVAHHCWYYDERWGVWLVSMAGSPINLVVISEVTGTAHCIVEISTMVLLHGDMFVVRHLLRVSVCGQHLCRRHVDYRAVYMLVRAWREYRDGAV